MTKWTVDGAGAARGFHGRNAAEREVAHDDRPSDGDGDGGGALHSVDLSPANMGEFLDSHESSIVDYHAPWCTWCQRLAPTWEGFAAEVSGGSTGAGGEWGWLGVGRVDCVEHGRTCVDEGVVAFPTIRWYEGRRAVVPDYGGDRTVEALMEYARGRRRSSSGPVVPGVRGGDGDDGDDGGGRHPGCMVHGHLLINRVPGHMVVGARSVNHVINPAMANLTHVVNHLWFGPSADPPGRTPPLGGGAAAAAMGEKLGRTDPMGGKYFPTYRPHEAYHHHMKVIGTRIGPPASSPSKEEDSVVYQVLQESQLALYDERSIPEIKFFWDISPVSVSLSREVRPWYDYVTNLLAIVGGAYTTLGLINATLLRIIKPKML